MAEEKTKSGFNTFAIVEMMGHRKVAALASESEIGGSSLLRLDVLGSDGEIERTEYIGVGSIYCLTVVTEETCKAAARVNAPRPSFAYGLSRALPDACEFNDESDDVDDDVDDLHLKY